MAMGQKTLLKNYPADQLTGNDLLAVETNISSYDIINKDFSHRCGHSLSLRSVYFLGEDPSPLSPKGRKRPASILVSTRENKKAGQVAFFSDDDE